MAGHSTDVIRLQTEGLKCLREGDFSGAEGKYVEAVAVAKETLGNDHLDTASALHRLAQVHMKQPDKMETAEKVLQEALEISRSKLGSSHMTTVSIIASLAEVFGALGKTEDAAPLMEQVRTAISNECGCCCIGRSACECTCECFCHDEKDRAIAKAGDEESESSEEEQSDVEGEPAGGSIAAGKGGGAQWK